jgi:hypothetical protein
MVNIPLKKKCLPCWAGGGGSLREDSGSEGKDKELSEGFHDEGCRWSVSLVGRMMEQVEARLVFMSIGSLHCMDEYVHW